MEEPEDEESAIRMTASGSARRRVPDRAGSPRGNSRCQNWRRQHRGADESQRTRFTDHQRGPDRGRNCSGHRRFPRFEKLKSHPQPSAVLHDSALLRRPPWGCGCPAYWLVPTQSAGGVEPARARLRCFAGARTTGRPVCQFFGYPFLSIFRSRGLQSNWQ